MALGADDAETAEFSDLRLELLRLFACALIHRRERIGIVVLALGVVLLSLFLRKLVNQILPDCLEAAAEQNIGTAACHVRRNRDCAHLTCLGDDCCLFLVVLRIQDFVPNTLSL